jgi:hypothetical protein
MQPIRACLLREQVEGLESNVIGVHRAWAESVGQDHEGDALVAVHVEGGLVAGDGAAVSEGDVVVAPRDREAEPIAMGEL